MIMLTPNGLELDVFLGSTTDRSVHQLLIDSTLKLAPLALVIEAPQLTHPDSGFFDTLARIAEIGVEVTIKDPPTRMRNFVWFKLFMELTGPQEWTLLLHGSN